MKDFDIGNEVIIVSLDGCSSRYTTDLLTKTGTIIDVYKDRCGIQISDMYNEFSSTGAYWVPALNLKLISREDKTMNFKVSSKNENIAILTKPWDKDDGSVGIYYGELSVGDLVVCDYGYNNKALSVRQVGAIIKADKDATVDCEIMGVCDISVYLEHKTKIERRAELKKQMIEQAKKYQEEEYWRLISETNPAMKALYDEFKALED